MIFTHIVHKIFQPINLKVQYYKVFTQDAHTRTHVIHRQTLLCEKFGLISLKTEKIVALKGKLFAPSRYIITKGGYPE